ncbi:hypothetical protein KJ636_05745 [Patescibacteria group bacterium]|nr:hypothetical protein [Patescibacteria group bacterium]
MEVKNLKELSIGVILSTCALGFVFLLGFSVYNLYKTLASTWEVGGVDIPYMSGTCEKFKDTYVVSVTVSNYKREVRDLKCKLASKGEMTTDKEEETLAILSPNSSDFCEFYLKGELVSPVRVRVTYAMKFLTGYKEYSTIVDPYPACSTLTGEQSPAK